MVKTEESKILIHQLDNEYSISKLTSEAQLRVLYQRGMCPLTICRFGIIYGNRLERWSAVEAMYNFIHKGEVIEVGSLKTSRFFIHVLDICCGLLETLNHDGFNLFNLEGPSNITL